MSVREVSRTLCLVRVRTGLEPEVQVAQGPGRRWSGWWGDLKEIQRDGKYLEICYMVNVKLVIHWQWSVIDMSTLNSNVVVSYLWQTEQWYVIVLTSANYMGLTCMTDHCQCSSIYFRGYNRTYLYTFVIDINSEKVKRQYQVICLHSVTEIGQETGTYKSKDKNLHKCQNDTRKTSTKDHVYTVSKTSKTTHI